jgi:hypothetical protein
VHSDRHWSFVEPVKANLQRGAELEYESSRYKLFQRAWARVVYVLGEFYWKVAVGEVVLAEDYICPPKMISLELTPENPEAAGTTNSAGWMKCKYSEMTASLGTYVPHEVIETGFGVQNLPRPATVAPNQPAPDNQQVYWLWPLFVAACLLLDAAFSSWARRPVDHSWTLFAVVAVSVFPLGVFLYNRSFEQSRWADSEFGPHAAGDD